MDKLCHVGAELVVDLTGLIDLTDYDVPLMAVPIDWFRISANSLVTGRERPTDSPN